MSQMMIRMAGNGLARALLALLLAVAAGAGQTAEPDERDFSRQVYGPSSSPVWSPLTAFEKATVAGHERAIAGDPDALLALYLLASGDVRTQPEFERYRRMIRERLPSFSPAAGPADRGEQLMDVLFTRFLGRSASGGEPLAGYEAEQSRLSTVLADGRYNCISSSLLYIVLARHAGLEANGVIIPSHAFVDITLADGEVVSVETTSPDGFAVEHDRAWFEGADEQWFRERDLDVPRYEDYQVRQRVSAAALGLENMWNQHAARLAYPDRLRLAELHAHLQPDNLRAQMNGMIYYTREAAWLREQGDRETLARFMEHTAAWRDHVAARMHESDARPGEDFLGLWYWLEVQRAGARVLSGRHHEGARLALDVLESLPAEVENRRTVRHNAHVVLDDYVQEVIGSGELEQAARLLDSLPALCGATPMCQQALARLYSGLAAVDWERGDWSAVIARLRDYLAMAGTDRFRPAIEENMEGAWLNWAEQNWYDEFREQAMERLRRCVSELDRAPRCQQRLAAYQDAAY